MRFGFNARVSRARLASFAVGSSVFAIAMGSASPAAAQCTPDPTVAGGTTNCTGTDSNGLNVPTNNTTIKVATDAIVTPGANIAAIVSGGAGNILSVAGEVAGGSRPGVILTNGDYVLGVCDPYAGAAVIYCPSPYVYYYATGSTSITVDAGASITGTNAIRLQSRSDSNGGIVATLVNSGTLTGSSGPAIFAEIGSLGRIENLETGVIMGIAAPVGTLTNAGLIDGGSASAIATTSGSITNSGTIRATTGAATISGASLSITNSGTIRNDGAGATVNVTGTPSLYSQSGALTLANQSGGSIVAAGGVAIYANGQLNVTNQAGATIGTTGSVAIQGDGPVSLSNAGTIDGSVVAGSGLYSGSTIDNSTGTINGDVLLGNGNDVLIARFDTAAGAIAGISGIIDGGAGIDQLQLGIDSDALFGQNTLPINFEQLRLTIANNAVVTIAGTNATSHGVAASGQGRLVNTAALVTTGSAIQTSWSNYSSTLDVENSGTITATMTGSYFSAVNVYPGSFINSGTVTSIDGAGVSVNGSSGTGSAQTLTNSGTITATSTGASLNYANLVNSGLIESTGGTGVTLYRNSVEGSSINSGTIRGAVTGLQGYSALVVNTGTIAGGINGILADQLRLDNQAGGIVRGGTFAIGSNSFGSGGSTVRNAGLIDGNIDLSSSYGYDSNRDTFIDAGGTVNGSLKMGGGDDLLVVQMSDDASRPLGGVTGDIDMGDGTNTIRYIAASDRSAVIALPSGFDAVAYGVSDGARLTLTSADPLTTTVGLTGDGTVDLTADIAITGKSAIDLTGQSVQEILAGGRPYDSTSINSALNVISRGDLTFNVGSDYWSGSSCAVSAGDATFENAGTIRAGKATGTDIGMWYPMPVAICDSATTINSGTIQVDGGYAVSGADTVINRGVMTDMAGSNGYGIYAATTIENSGSLIFDGQAIAAGYGAPISITNSGTIKSRTDVAIVMAYDSTLVNEATGTIRAPETAISAINSKIVNRGRIIGNVELTGAEQQPSSLFRLLAVETAGSTYVADGGTLEGNLRFRGTDNIFVQSGATTGVTGTITGSDGFDRIVLSRDGSGSFTGATGFERLDVEAGQWTLAGTTNVQETAIAEQATLIGTTALLTGEIANAGTLRIAQDFDGTFGGALTGNGALVKDGTGTVAMGTQLGFTGNTTVLGGRLLMAGQTAARLSVIGGVLGGTGTVGALSIGNGGTVSPGDGGIGTLTVTGDFTQGAGSTYLANVTASGLSDRIVVGGTATIAQGARLTLSGSTGDIGTRYTLLTAAGGLSGTYDVTQMDEMLELRLVYSPTSLFADVALSARGVGAIAATDNQRAAAAGLVGLTASNAAYASITLDPAVTTVRDRLDQLSGEVHASLGAAMVLDARIVEDAVLTRTLAREPGSGIWGSMIGNRATDDGDSQSAALRRSTFGAVGGVDFGLEGARMGVGVGYTRTDLSVDARLSNGRTETVHVLGYASGEVGPVAVRAGVGYAWADNRVDRSVGFVGERLSADYNGNTLYTFAEAGHGFALGSGSVQPFVGLESYRISTDAFTETGGSAALRGADRTESFAFTRAGLRAETPIVEGISARANAAWLHRIDGENPSVRVAYAGTTSSFEVSGVPLSRDAASLGLDVVWAPVDNIRIVSGYNGRIGGRGEDNSFRLMASVGF